jgi:UDP-GlcNAc:undecaprenyl-phosphate GlcNAc-1-phosphate transferase
VETFLFLGLTSFVLCLFLTPLARELFRWLKIVDRPDQRRKIHCSPIPRAGGVAIVLSYFGSIALALVFLPQGSRLAIHHASLFSWLIPAVAVIFVTGLLDDIFGLSPKTKLTLQFFAASLACWGGVRIVTINDHEIAAWLGVPLTVLWLLACCNAINLIDGLDGLAAGVGLFAALTAITVAAIQGNVGLVLATVPLAGCLLAFLRYNFNPASVFLGDSGSLTVGFLLGCFAVIWCQKIATLTGLMAPLVSLLVPLLDVSLSVARRFVSNRPIFSPDRGHIHHRLLARGLPPKNVALLLYAVCGATGVLAVSLCLLEGAVGTLILLLALVLAAIAIWKLRFVEFEVLKQLIFTGHFRRSVEEGVRLLALQEDLLNAESVDDYWNLIIKVSEAEHIQSVKLKLSSATFQRTFHPALENEVWSMEFVLEPSLTLTIRGFYSDGEPQGSPAVRRVLQIASKVKLLNHQQAPSLSTV